MTTKRAAIYVRAACDDTQGVELARQEQLLREWAEHRGDVVVKVYADLGPGLIEPRPGLGQLMTDAKAGLFDVLLLRDPARLFRRCLLFRLCYDRLHQEFGLEVAYYCPNCPTTGGAS
jgi:DNA invertase Pin-like site-specific DNA recombinase